MKESKRKHAKRVNKNKRWPWRKCRDGQAVSESHFKSEIWILHLEQRLLENSPMIRISVPSGKVDNSLS